MRSFWTYTALTALAWALAAVPGMAQAIGGGTQPPTKNNTPPGKEAAQPPKTDTPGTSSTDAKKDGEAEKDPIVDAAAALFKEGKEEEAYKKLLEASTKNDKLPPARLMMHRMYLSAGRAVDARRAIELAAVENPDHPDVYITFAMQALQQSRLTDAWLQFERALLTVNDTKRWNESQRKSVGIAARRRG